MSKNSFPTSEHLKSRILIDKLFSEGRVIKKYPLKAIVISNEYIEAIAGQAGFSVPKRLFKKAVDRNLLKRRMREAYRIQKAEYSEDTVQYAVMFIYTTPKKMNYHDIQRAMIHILDHLPDRL